MKAEIEERRKEDAWVLYGIGSNPHVVSKERAILSCGCAVYVGLRVDTLEPATTMSSCSTEHKPMMHRCNELLKKSLDNPQDRKIIEVVQELLDKANSEREAGVV